MTREIVASKKQDWGTPRAFFSTLNAEYGFTLDVCAASYNACLPRWYGPGSPVAEDGLLVSWAGEVCFCNPPYENIEAWLRKGLLESVEGAKSVFLIPANTDTRWFHEYAVVGQVDFIKGRLSFEDLTPPEIELARVLALYEKRNAANLLKQLALLLNELGATRQVSVGGFTEPDSDSALDRARWHCSQLGDGWPTEARKPGPGFPSMVVTFDPEAPAGEKAFRRRDKTGALL